MSITWNQGEDLTAQDERRIYDRIDLLIISLSQLISTHGEWVNSVIELLDRFADGQEVPDRILFGPPESLEYFRRHIAPLKEELIQATLEVARTFYEITCNEVLVAYLEPGCSTSPVRYAIGRDARLTISVNPDVDLMCAGGAEQGAESLQILRSHIAAQERLVRLLWHFPLKPHELLDRMECFTAIIGRYRDDLQEFRDHQQHILGSDDVAVVGTHTEERLRAALFASLKTARLFPADLLSLHTKVAQLHKQILDLQGHVLIKSVWMLKKVWLDYAATGQRKAISQEEFEAEGLAQMAKLMRTFNWRMGNRFSSYAFRDLTSHLRDMLLGAHGAIRITPDASKRLGLLRQETRTFTARHGYEPSPREMAEKLGMKVDQCRDLMMISGHQFSLQETIAPEIGDRNNAEAIADPTYELPENVFTGADRQEIVRELFLGTLDFDEQRVVSWITGYGLDAPMAAADIAKALGISTREVAVIKRSALEKLGRALQKQPRAAEIFDSRRLADLRRHLGPGRTKAKKKKQEKEDDHLA